MLWTGPRNEGAGLEEYWKKMGTPPPVKLMEKSKGGPGMMGEDLSNDIQVVRFEAKVRGHTDEGLSYTLVRSLNVCSLCVEELEKT